MDESRKSVRFMDIGRVEAPEICSIPGVLEDISLTGCKIHFPISVSIDMEKEYEVTIYPSRQNIEKIVLICQPVWLNVDEELDSSVGFSILRSPGSSQLVSYVKFLQVEDSYSEDKEIVNNKCKFI